MEVARAKLVAAVWCDPQWTWNEKMANYGLKQAKYVKFYMPLKSALPNW